MAYFLSLSPLLGEIHLESWQPQRCPWPGHGRGGCRGRVLGVGGDPLCFPGLLVESASIIWKQNLEVTSLEVTDLLSSHPFI